LDTSREQTGVPVRIGDVPVGGGSRLALIAGLNVIETLEETLECARVVRDVSERHRIPAIFKACFDKANRSSIDSHRGPGIDEGLRILGVVKRETGLPLVTDVHEPVQAKLAAEVVDCVQVPAFLSRQTDLLVACAATGLPVNVKKGQFLTPAEMRHAVEKLRRHGEGGVLLTERGTSFGYNNLVVDMRGLVEMRAFAPVCFDATHAVQLPGAREQAAGGDRRLVAPLARAAVAVGIDALFIETHVEPERAPCDGPSQIDFESFDRLVAEACAVDAAVRTD